MKKLYTLAALALCGMTAAAQSLYFTLDGQKIENGTRVELTQAPVEENGVYMIAPKFLAHNDNGGSTVFEGKTGTISCTPEMDANWEKGATMAYQVCGFGSCFRYGSDKTFGGTVDMKADEAFDFQAEFVLDLGSEQKVSELEYSGEVTVKMTCGSETAEITIYAHNATNAIDTIVTDNTACATEYFDLNGRRLDAPVKGINIVRRGSDVTKVIL